MRARVSSSAGAGKGALRPIHLRIAAAKPKPVFGFRKMSAVAISNSIPVLNLWIRLCRWADLWYPLCCSAVLHK